MALLDTVNIIGSSIYFIFAVLLAWLNSIPRTNPGTNYWALALIFGLLARLSLLLLYPLFPIESAEYFYASCILLEKYFLLLGAFKFFDLPHYARPYTAFMACSLVWLLITLVGHFDHILFSFGVGLFSACAVFLLAFITYREHRATSQNIMLYTSIICCVLGIHWLSYPVLRFTDHWQAPGFFIGAMFVILQYLCLISATLLQFEKRLLEAESNALELAHHDPLTGLNNQRYVNTLFEQALILANRPHQMLAVLYIDLDNFKPINDTAGHQVGDEVLKIIAKRLSQHTRSTDICARMGGDEFVVIATQLETEEQVYQVATKLLQQCCDAVEINNQQYRLGASIGISIYPQHGNNLNQLLKNADYAMYEVKKNGKSGYQLFKAAS
jgi:diguanylate cyclase (GGDEF)-like protein